MNRNQDTLLQAILNGQINRSEPEARAIISHVRHFLANKVQSGLLHYPEAEVGLCELFKMIMRGSE